MLTDEERNGWTMEALEEEATRRCGWVYKPNLSTNAGIAWETVMRLIAKHERPPVDPVLAAARKICADTSVEAADAPSRYLSGEWDAHTRMQIAIASIRRGMELAQEQRP